MNLPARAPTTRKFEGDDYIELAIAHHPKTSWYWQHDMIDGVPEATVKPIVQVMTAQGYCSSQLKLVHDLADHGLADHVL